MPALRLAAGAVLALVLAGPALALPPVWVVKDRDSIMTIFGSVHVLPAGLDWRPPALEAALKTADDLWFEFPPATAADAERARKASEAGLLPPGQALSKLLPPADAAQLARIADKHRIDRATLERLKPWMAEVMLTQQVLARTAGATGDHSVEAWVQAATPARVQRRALETGAQQLALFQDPPLPQQVAALKRAMDTLERDPNAYRRVLDAWMSGDPQRLVTVAVEPERKADPAGFRRLVTDRSALWAKTLDARLKGKGRTVVIVGVGHLVGPDSLIARLRALGYSVTGP
jgi:uncharacterized protein YbaP (TraB family)